MPVWAKVGITASTIYYGEDNPPLAVDVNEKYKDQEILGTWYDISLSSSMNDPNTFDNVWVFSSDIVSISPETTVGQNSFGVNAQYIAPGFYRYDVLSAIVVGVTTDEAVASETAPMMTVSMGAIEVQFPAWDWVLVPNLDLGNNIFGTNGSDILVGTVGDDAIFGGLEGGHVPDELGDDQISGGAGNDLIVGHGGNDTLSGDEGSDTIDGGDGKDAVFGGSGYDSLNGGAGDDVLDVGADGGNAFGNDGNDELTGGVVGEQLQGGEGNDTINAGAGNDSLVDDDSYGSTGNDVLNAGAGNDTINSYGGSDNIDGGEGDDFAVIDRSTVAGGLTVSTTGGTSSLNDGTTIVNVERFQFVLGAGDDSITLADTDDFIDGGDGNDSFDAGNGTNTVIGGSGQDTIHLSGMLGDYVVSNAGGTSVRLTDLRTSAFALVSSVEAFAFADGTRTYDTLVLAPHSLSLSASSVAENSAPTTVIGRLSAIDSDFGGAMTYSLSTMLADCLRFRVTACS